MENPLCGQEDGRESLQTASERYYPAPGQKFFLEGGVIDEAKYEYRGPETPSARGIDKNRAISFPSMRIWPYAGNGTEGDMGMMVGEEGRKTKIPILEKIIRNRRGFDPAKHMLQRAMETAGSPRSFAQERQLSGAPGGIMHDWDLKTNIDVVFSTPE